MSELVEKCDSVCDVEEMNLRLTLGLEWKARVSIPSCAISAGRSGVGLAKLATMATVGYCLDPSDLTYPGIRPHTAACEYFAAARQ
jgi:hypothetical protein